MNKVYLLENNTGQAVIEFTVVIFFLLVPILVGLIFFHDYNSAYINQQMNVRNLLTSKESSASGISFASPTDFLRTIGEQILLPTEFSSISDEIKVPESIKAEIFGDESVNAKAKLYSLKGTWSAANIVDILSDTLSGNTNTTINAGKKAGNNVKKMAEDERRANEIQ